MSIAGYMWECKCGHMEYGEEYPEECPKCFSLDSFTQLPEELILEREKDLGEEEMDLMPTKKKIAKTKTLKEKKNESKKKKKVK